MPMLFAAVHADSANAAAPARNVGRGFIAILYRNAPTDETSRVFEIH